MSVATEAVTLIILRHLGMGREDKPCFLKVPATEECTWGARFQELYVLIDECTWGAGFQEKYRPSRYLESTLGPVCKC